MRILFLCSDNACLGPMAEGWARWLKPTRLDVVAAGVTVGRRDSLAVRVMAECGIDIHRLPLRSLAEVADRRFDLVIALSTDAHLALPALPGDPRVLFLDIVDPRPRMNGSNLRLEPARILERYRSARDEIRDFIETLPEGLVPVNQKYYWVQPEFLQPAEPRN
ncbi:MAG: arsenate reductase ArsC [Planctomycetota bacterium]